jgi:hypothetical protein
MEGQIIEPERTNFTKIEITGISTGKQYAGAVLPPTISDCVYSFRVATGGLIGKDPCVIIRNFYCCHCCSTGNSWRDGRRPALKTVIFTNSEQPVETFRFREGEAPAEPELWKQLAFAAQRELRPPFFNGALTTKIESDSQSHTNP